MCRGCSAVVPKTRCLLLLQPLLLPSIPQHTASELHHRKPHPLGCRQGQLKLGLWMATHRCLLEPILARWCLCTTVAPIMCLALSCQPSCDITRCYMEVLLGPGCCCWQTRMGGCWWKRLLVCLSVCLCVCVCACVRDESLLSLPLSCPSLLKNSQITQHIFPKHCCT